MSEIFISHSIKNIKQIKRLVELLEKNDISVWYAKRDLQVGEDWQQVIQNKLMKVDFCIICLGRQKPEG